MVLSFARRASTPHRQRHDSRFRRLRLEKLEERIALATLPAGFTEAAVASGLSSATAMEIAPDGKLFITEQAGTMEVWQGGSRLQANFFQATPITTDTASERGLLGIAFDPNYASNRFVYVYYTTTAADRHNRVSRFTANAAGDLALAGGEDVIMELDAHSAGNHNGGAMHFGPDGMLYIATGDNATGSNAQSLLNRHGKILRVDVRGDDFPTDAGQDYRIPAGQPTTFAGISGSPTGVNRSIWAVGLRNPFTFAFQPGTGRLFINDVGQNTWEEINEGAAGRNFGWPAMEGNEPAGGSASFTRPFFTYDHGGAEPNGVAITGGAFYNPTTNQFPSEYVGDYFFADFGSNEIWRIDTTTKVATEFASNASAPVDLKVDAAGNLYYLARGANQVFRVSLASQPPTINDQPDSQTITQGQPVTFTVVASGASPLTYRWQRAESGTSSFINIAGATAASFSLSNVQAADHGDQFQVIVTDNASRSTTSAVATLTVTTNRPPSATITINGGLRGGRWDAGTAVNFSGTGTDPDQGTLPASRFTWQVDYLTTTGGGDADGDGLPGITRPFVPAFSNTTSSSFTPATTGPYTLTDVAHVITLTVTDNQGLTDVERLVINPNTATLTVTTSPAGLQITVDGQPFTGPRSFGSVVGFQRPIGAPTTQTVNGTNYAFASWSDGGAATHTISTPAANTTYTANYQATPFIARINFQDGTSAGFSGFVADTGLVFGNRAGGLSYGWNFSNTANARNRNAASSPDERYDTLNHLQKPSNPNAVWEIAVPNGTYSVRIVSGDPNHTDSVYRTQVEKVLAVSGTPTSSNRWFEGVVTVTVTDGRLTVENASGASNNKINLIEIAAGTPPARQQDAGTNGLVVAEVENNDGNLAQGGKSWTAFTATSGFSGASALQATPNTGINNDTGFLTNSPRLDFRVNFVKTGVHHVWIRGIGPTGSDDSVNVGLDGAAVTTADRISSFSTSAYSWTHNTMDGVVATINVTTTGVHTVNLWMREDGTIVDKILLTTSASFTPTGLGPAESPRASAASSQALAASSSPTSNPRSPGSARLAAVDLAASQQVEEDPLQSPALVQQLGSRSRVSDDAGELASRFLRERTAAIVNTNAAAIQRFLAERSDSLPKVHDFVSRLRKPVSLDSLDEALAEL